MKRRIFSAAITIALAASAAIFAGCSTTESRISEHRDMFNSLSAGDQALVTQGQIRSGMSQNAVWLSFGAPDQKLVGEIRGRASETWVYVTYTDAYPYGPYGAGYGFGYGRGYGGFGGGYAVRSRGGRRYFIYGDPFYDPFYSAIPPRVQYPDKTVTFVNGRVISFQRMAPTGGRY